MKFAIFNEIEVEGKKKRKILVELDQEKIEDALIKKTLQYLITHTPEEAVYFAFKEVVEDFKKESIKIP